MTRWNFHVNDNVRLAKGSGLKHSWRLVRDVVLIRIQGFEKCCDLQQAPSVFWPTVVEVRRCGGTAFWIFIFCRTMSKRPVTLRRWELHWADLQDRENIFATSRRMRFYFWDCQVTTPTGDTTGARPVALIVSRWCKVPRDHTGFVPKNILTSALGLPVF